MKEKWICEDCLHELQCNELGKCAKGSSAADCSAWSKGDDYKDADLYTAGISIGDHTNAIECYGKTPEIAAAIRDQILKQNAES